MHVDDTGRAGARRTVGGALALVALLGTLAVGGSTASAQPSAPNSFGGTPTVTTALSPELHDTTGVAVDAAGNVYAADEYQVVERTSGGALTVLSFGTSPDPHDVAVDGAGNVYVTEFNGNQVRKRTPGGTVTTVGFTGLGNDPSGLAVTPNGKVYVSDTSNGRILAITATGVASTVTAAVAKPTDLALDDAGNLYVLDSSNHKVWKVPVGGGAPTVLAFGTFVQPSGLAVDSAGTVWVGDYADSYRTTLRSLTAANVASSTTFAGISTVQAMAVDGSDQLLMAESLHDRVFRRTATGELRTVIAGHLAVTNPWGMDVGPDGTLYFAALDGSVSAYGADGVQRVLPFTGLSNPEDVVADSAGNVYVADGDGDKVLKLTLAGVTSEVSFGSLDGPFGLAIDGNDNLYVADRFHYAVKKRTPGGTVSTVSFTGLDGPLDIDATADGTLYLLDGAGTGNRVVKRTPGGTQSTISFTNAVDSRFIAVDAAGTVYVRGTSPEGVRLLKRTSAGVESTVPFANTIDPRGIAIGGDGTLYMADYYNSEQHIWKKPTDGSSQVEVGRSALSYGRPSVAIGSSGQLVVADGGADRIFELPAGPAAPRDFAGLNNPTSLAAGKDGHLYVSVGTTKVYDLAPNGTATPLGFAPSHVGELGVDSKGTVYSRASGNLYKLPKGGVESMVPRPSFLTGLSTFAVGGDDSLYLFGSQTSARVSPGGVVTNLNFDPDAPTESAVDAAGNLYVVPYAMAGGIVERFADGSTANVPFPPRPPGLLSIAVDPNGTVFLAGPYGISRLDGWPPTGPFSSWNKVVTRQYTDLLGRTPTATELSAAVGQVSGGAKTVGQIDDGLRRSTENTTNVDPTVRLYRAFLARTPDAGGLKFWIGRRRSGSWSLTKMADSFASSNEFKTKYGSLTNRQFVTRIYTDVLGRTADAAGVDYWTGKLDRKERTRGQVMVGFSESSEYKRQQAENTDVAVAYILLLGRSPSAGEVTTWVTAQKGGTTHAVLLQQILDSPAYAARTGG